MEFLNKVVSLLDPFFAWANKLDDLQEFIVYFVVGFLIFFLLPWYLELPIAVVFIYAVYRDHFGPSNDNENESS